tara:strand:+ start:7658 stop:8032 length:375 start_codon:yes stop_codon:yes gene_type:complete
MLARKTFAVFFIVLFLGTLLVHSVIKVHFDLNRSEIAELFCVNKDKPELHCNGQCELMKRLNAQEDQNEKAPDLRDNRTETNWIQPKEISISPEQQSVEEKIIEPLLVELIKSIFSVVDVPPPQ